MNIIQQVLKMQWSDYLDILVVAFLIYKLLPLLRTPHIMRLARTVIALVAISWITSVAKLYTINWILNQFLAIGLLAFVVLFQPELRRMLDHLGNVKLTRFFGLRFFVRNAFFLRNTGGNVLRLLFCAFGGADASDRRRHVRA